MQNPLVIDFFENNLQNKNTMGSRFPSLQNFYQEFIGEYGKNELFSKVKISQSKINKDFMYLPKQSKSNISITAISRDIFIEIFLLAIEVFPINYYISPI